ncbi:MAG: hypothetical protein IPH31_06040 [Lewinellaceae bacterium]|nr:hypothetical protein [Lewinellaceae bacterium]
MKKQYFPAFLFVLTIATPVFAQQILSVTSTVQAPYDNMSDLIRDHLTGSGVEILSVESNNDFRSVGFFHRWRLVHWPSARIDFDYWFCRGSYRTRQCVGFKR